MTCEKCGASLGVIDSRESSDGSRIRRRRKCAMCGHRITTVELQVDEYEQQSAKVVQAFLTSEKTSHAMLEAMTDVYKHTWPALAKEGGSE